MSLQGLGVWVVWLVAGLLVVLLLPRGAYIHDYYLWWLLIPSTGFVAWAIDHTELLPEKTIYLFRTISLQQTVLIILMITSLGLSGYHVARGPVDASELLGDNSNPDDMGAHSKELATTLDMYVTEEGRVLAYSDKSMPIMPAWLALVRVGAVELSRASVIESEARFDPEAYDIIVSPLQLESRLSAHWTRASTVEAAGYKTHIYVQNSST